MALIEIQNLSFAYNGAKNKALDGVSLTVEKGDFVLLCGASGCGKTTLLRLLKPLIAPCGTSRGTVLFDGVPTEQLDMRSGVSQIGFVMQNPDAQIVTDKVWHELAFCAESLGMTTGEIRAKVAEVCGVLGIDDLSTSARASCPADKSNLSTLLRYWLPTRKCCCLTSRLRNSIPLRRRIF